MKKFTSQIFLIAALAAMTVIYALTIDLKEQDMIVSGLAIVIIGLSLGIERLAPFSKNWNKSEGDLGGDITSFVVIFGILDSVLKAMTPFLILLVMPDFGQFNLELPLWAEVIAAGMLIEIAAYISHRLHHKSKYMWQLHAMHHSTKRLYTLNNFRFHPLNHIINHLFMIAPVIALGFSPQAILGYTAFTLPILLTQHSNIDFKFGWLNLVFNTNEVHRWHHSNDESQGNCNLGRALVIWDQVFGTFYLPKSKTTPDELGLFSSNKNFPAPNALWSQIAYPFSKQCCSEAA